MHAAIARGPRELSIESVPVPEPGPGEARVRIEACGICGSDLHLYEHGILVPGRTPGHEMMGTVEALGDGVAQPRSGDRVAIEPFRVCGECAACRSGRQSICRQAVLIGVGADGGFAERVVIPARALFPVPAGLDAPVAALVEPLAVCVHGLRRAGFEPGQRVLVLGAGAVGLLAVRAARALGASEVLATARHPHQAHRAAAIGADRVLGEAEATPEALTALGSEVEIDVVLETVGGRADTLAGAAAAVRPGGCVSVLGVFMGPVTLDTLPYLLKEVTLAWSYCYDHGEEHADFREAVEIVAREPGLVAPLVTHTLPLSEVGRAYEIASNKREGAIKVSVVPD